jgi:hypothetical protein
LHASELQEQTWSLRFNNVAVEDMLKQLSQATGVDISTNKTPNMERITRSCENQTMEHIIRDVFRGTSYTLVWHYGENHLESIGICFFDGDSGASRKLSTNRKSGPTNRFTRRSSTQSSPRSPRQITQPKKRLPRDLAASGSIPKRAAQKRSEDDEDEDEDEDAFDEED